MSTLRRIAYLGYLVSFAIAHSAPAHATAIGLVGTTIIDFSGQKSTVGSSLSDHWSAAPLLYTGVAPISSFTVELTSLSSNYPQANPQGISFESFASANNVVEFSMCNTTHCVMDTPLGSSAAIFRSSVSTQGAQNALEFLDRLVQGHVFQTNSGRGGISFNSAEGPGYVSGEVLVRAYGEIVAIPELEVAAIPEPSTYMMLLAGLGLLGFMARRRTQ